MSKVVLKAYLVEEVEFERGWGARVEDQYLFPTQELAKQFVEAYNKKWNNESYTPDWYMKQFYIGSWEVSQHCYDQRKYKGSDFVSEEAMSTPCEILPN